MTTQKKILLLFEHILSKSRGFKGEKLASGLGKKREMVFLYTIRVLTKAHLYVTISKDFSIVH